jgi:hypothetical protein
VALVTPAPELAALGVVLADQRGQLLAMTEVMIEGGRLPFLGLPGIAGLTAGFFS